MKKLLSVLILSSLVLIITLTGCSTTVAFDVLKPAEVNMSEYRTLQSSIMNPMNLPKSILPATDPQLSVRVTGDRFYRVQALSR